MSEVEQYWQAIASKWGDERQWHELNGQQQQVVIQSINALPAALHRIV